MAIRDRQPRLVRIVRGGQDYNGHFTIEGTPPKVNVASAYGSAEQALGKGDEMKVAKRLMEQIVAAQSRF